MDTFEQGAVRVHYYIPRTTHESFGCGFYWAMDGIGHFEIACNSLQDLRFLIKSLAALERQEDTCYGEWEIWSPNPEYSAHYTLQKGSVRFPVPDDIFRDFQAAAEKMYTDTLRVD